MTTTNIQNMSYDEMMKLSEITTDAEELQRLLNSVKYIIKEMSGYINWDYFRLLLSYEREIENKLKEVK